MLSFKNFLIEGLDNQVHFNPSAEKIHAIVKRSIYNHARFAIDHNNNLWVGDSYNFIHANLGDGTPQQNMKNHVYHGYIQSKNNRTPTIHLWKLGENGGPRVWHPKIDNLVNSGKFQLYEGVFDSYDDKTTGNYNVKAHKKYFDYQGIHKIPISSLIKTQHDYSDEVVHSYLNKEKTPWVDHLDHNDPIDVILHNGKHYIQDGHHRVMANLKIGNTTVNAHIHKTNKKFKEGKRFLFEGAKLYHGTTKPIEKLERQKDNWMVDRSLGTHYAGDKDMSDKFAKGLYKDNDHGHSQTFETRRPPKSKLVKVRGKGWDQTNISTHVAHTVLSNPNNKDLYYKWYAANHQNGNPQHAEELYNKLMQNRGPNRQTNFKHYARGIDPGMHMMGQDGKEEMVDRYHQDMKKKGIMGIEYINTSPSETKGVRNKKSYVIFDPTKLPHTRKPV
jgi:hypothetical protein